MANYANQKKVNIDKEQVNCLIHHTSDPTKGYYPPLEYSYIDKAAELLNGNAFKIWLYLLRWYNQGYVFFSPAALEGCMGLKKSSVSDSWNELVNKGFIHKQQNLTYLFTPISTKLV